MRHTHHTILILSLLVLTVGLLLVPLGLNYKIHVIGDETVALTQEAKALEQAQHASTETKRAATLSEASLDALMSHVLSEDDVVAFLASLEGLSKTTGATIKIENVSVKTPAENSVTTAKGVVKTTGPKVLEVSLSGVGTFAEIYKLSKIIETLPYEISIESEGMTVMREILESDTSIPNLNQNWTENLTLVVNSYLPHEIALIQK